MPVLVNTNSPTSEGSVPIKTPLTLSWYAAPDSPAFTFSSGFAADGFHYIQHTNDAIWRYDVKEKKYERLGTGNFTLHGNYSKLIWDEENDKVYSMTCDETRLIYVYVADNGVKGKGIEKPGFSSRYYLLNGFRLGQFYPIVWKSKIYTFGGIYNGGITNVVYEIDPTNNKFTWSQYSTLPISVRYPNVTFDGVENVYTTSGSTTISENLSNKFIKFNLRTKESTELPGPGHGFSGFGGYLNYVGNGKIHYAGGGTAFREMFYVDKNRWVRLEDSTTSKFAAGIYDPSEDSVHVHGGHIGRWDTYHHVHKM